MKRKRVIVKPTPVAAAPAPAGRTEVELDISHPSTSPKDADGWPIVAGCWVRAAVDGAPYGLPVKAVFTGPVIRVARVEGGRDHGRVIVYVRTEDSGRWGRVAPIEAVRVRRKPAHVKSDERRLLD